jgi:hypothetical protein
LREADVQYTAQIREDCEGILGPGIRVLSVEREDRRNAVRLVARYEAAGRTHESDASAKNVVLAHAALRRRLAADRLRLGFTALVERR